MNKENSHCACGERRAWRQRVVPVTQDPLNRTAPHVRDQNPKEVRAGIWDL